MQIKLVDYEPEIINLMLWECMSFGEDYDVERVIGYWKTKMELINPNRRVIGMMYLKF